MIEYKAFELHSHTQHSDGHFTVDELCRACKSRDLDGVALTDHNTMSGWRELTPQLQDETLPVVRGIEWTTFFGHMLVLGAEKYVDWRGATPQNIDTYTRAIQQVKGAVGIAHPFALGNPFCTGCHWEFDVHDWSAVNYIEVWSGESPQFEPCNEPGYQWWTDLLNKGYRLAATNGRDWHGPDEKPLHMPVTYLGVEDGVVSTATARDALRAGRSYVTSGPAITLGVRHGNALCEIGSELPQGESAVHWSVDMNVRRPQWEAFGIEPQQVLLIQNGAPVATAPLKGECYETGYFDTCLWPGWLRLEVTGRYAGHENQLLAFTSPIYITE